MKLGWQWANSGDLYAFPDTAHPTGNAVAVIFRNGKDKFRVMVRDDVNNLSRSLWNVPHTTIDGYETAEEAIAAVNMLYRMQVKKEEI